MPALELCSAPAPIALPAHSLDCMVQRPPTHLSSPPDAAIACHTTSIASLSPPLLPFAASVSHVEAGVLCSGARHRLHLRRRTEPQVVRQPSACIAADSPSCAEHWPPPLLQPPQPPLSCYLHGHRLHRPTAWNLAAVTLLTRRRAPCIASKTGPCCRLGPRSVLPTDHLLIAYATCLHLARLHRPQADLERKHTVLG